MNKIDKYLSQALLRSYLLSLVVVVSLFLVFHFIEELGKDYSLVSKFEYVLYTAPMAFNNFFPIALIIATLLAVGAFNTNNELQIILSSGISLRNFSNKVLLVVFLFSFFSTITSEFFSPYFSERAIQTKALALNQNFVNSNKNIWLKNENILYNFGRSIDGKEFKQIRIFVFNNNLLVKVISSPSGKIDGNNLSIFKPKILEFTDEDSLVKTNFVEKESLNFELNLNSSGINSLKKDVRTLNYFDILGSISFLNSNGIDSNEYISELMQRTIKPFYVVGLLMISLPFIYKFGRKKPITKITLIGVSISLLFILISKIFNTLSSTYELNIYLTSLFPTLLIIFFGTIYFKYKVK